MAESISLGVGVLRVGGSGVEANGGDGRGGEGGCVFAVLGLARGGHRRVPVRATRVRLFEVGRAERGVAHGRRGREDGVARRVRGTSSRGARGGARGGERDALLSGARRAGIGVGPARCVVTRATLESARESVCTILATGRCREAAPRGEKTGGKRISEIRSIERHTRVFFRSPPIRGDPLELETSRARRRGRLRRVVRSLSAFAGYESEDVRTGKLFTPDLFAVRRPSTEAKPPSRVAAGLLHRVPSTLAASHPEARGSGDQQTQATCPP